MSQTTIAAGVDALHERAGQQPATETTSPFAREQQALAGLTPTGVITAGERLTSARLFDARGADTTLSAAVGKKPAVLVFYRGA